MRYFVVILGIFGLEWKIKNYIEETKTEDTEEEKCKGMLLIRKPAVFVAVSVNPADPTEPATIAVTSATV